MLSKKDITIAAVFSPLCIFLFQCDSTEDCTVPPGEYSLHLEMSSFEISGGSDCSDMLRTDMSTGDFYRNLPRDTTILISPGTECGGTTFSDDSSGFTDGAYHWRYSVSQNITSDETGPLFGNATYTIIYLEVGTVRNTEVEGCSATVDLYVER